VIPYFVFEQVQVGPFVLKIWGLFVALGILLGVIVSARRAERYSIYPSAIYDLAFWVTLAAVAGGRAVYVWTNDLPFTSLVNVSMSGFSSAGAIIPAFAVTVLYSKLKSINLLSVLETVAPGLLLAEAIGRIGCFLLHEHIGIKTVLPVSINIFGEQRHELSIYFFSSAIVGSVLALFFGKIINRKGAVSLFAITWYFFFRFLIDFLAEDSGPLAVNKYYGLSYTQYFSLAGMVFVAAYVITRMLKRYRNISLRVA